QIARIGEVNFADKFGRARTNQIGVVHKFLIGLHALFTFGARHAVGETGHDRKVQIFALRPVQNHAKFVDEGEFAAIADDSDGIAFGDVHTDVIGKNALHAGGLHPGNLLDFVAAAVQRNAQHTAPAILVERLQDCFPGDDAIAVYFDLVWLQQEN